MYVRGVARVDGRTKNLVKRLTPNDIAVINHPNLDNLAARALLSIRPRAVINAARFTTGDYPNPGPLALVQRGIVLIDQAGERVLEKIKEGQVVEIIDGKIYREGILVGCGQVLEETVLKEKMARARGKMNAVLADFIRNTLEHAGSEIGLVTGEYPLPAVTTEIEGRHVLVVVRGEHYREDLSAIKFYIKEVKPVLIGVDGGADALLESGHRPALIIGDMDSVSDAALCCGAEIVVHAYPDGRAPGLERVRRLSRPAKIFAVPGTSEDIAILLAYEKGADLIVLVGAHSCVEDFLEKGRRGMGSTFLVRMKTGSILVDAKGVSKLYRHRVRTRHVAQLFLAALLPTGIVIFVSPVTRELLRLIYLQFKLIFGI